MISGRERLTSELLLIATVFFLTILSQRDLYVCILSSTHSQTEIVYDFLVADFDKTVGYEYLRGMHLNDSKAALGSNKDRHENIGMCVFVHTFPYQTLS